jgi:hypothetical protein
MDPKIYVLMLLVGSIVALYHLPYFSSQSGEGGSPQ